jgi:hypothetical protein
VSGAGYVASAVQVRKPVVSHHDHNHRLILPSSPQVRKPVFNAFKLLREAGPARWGVAVRSEQDWAGSAEAPVLFAALSNAGRAVDLVFANHEQPALNLSVALVGAAAPGRGRRGCAWSCGCRTTGWRAPAYGSGPTALHRQVLSGLGVSQHYSIVLQHEGRADNSHARSIAYRCASDYLNLLSRRARYQLGRAGRTLSHSARLGMGARHHSRAA